MSDPFAVLVGYETAVEFADGGSPVNRAWSAMEDRGGAICVLGCRSGSAALERRARAAGATFVERNASLVVACGGIAWGGRVEADELARMLREAGVPEDAIVRERRSRDTHENATYAAKLLRERGVRDVVVVTCSWHLPRARRLFERAGLRVVGAIGVPPPSPGLLARAYWRFRERIAFGKDLLRAERRWFSGSREHEDLR